MRRSNTFFCSPSTFFCSDKTLFLLRKTEWFLVQELVRMLRFPRVVLEDCRITFAAMHSFYYRAEFSGHELTNYCTV